MNLWPISQSGRGHPRGKAFGSGLVGKPCMRCGDILTKHHRKHKGYCGHCSKVVNNG
jgi:hypothetical protein